jgi:hypothetical protein
MQIAFIRGNPGSLFGGGQSRKEHGGQDGNDGNDHQKFDQGKRPRILFGKKRHS